MALVSVGKVTICPAVAGLVVGNIQFPGSQSSLWSTFLDCRLGGRVRSGVRRQKTMTSKVGQAHYWNWIRLSFRLSGANSDFEGLKFSTGNLEAALALFAPVAKGRVRWWDWCSGFYWSWVRSDSMERTKPKQDCRSRLGRKAVGVVNQKRKNLQFDCLPKYSPLVKRFTKKQGREIRSKVGAGP